nr:MAG: hypothetical protein 3 [Leviviridae sp.]
MDFEPVILQKLLDGALPKTEAFLTSDMSVRDARCLWLKQSLLKKYVSPDKALDKARQDKARDLFLTMNERCGSSFQLSRFDDYELLALDYAKGAIARTLMQGALNIPLLTLEKCLLNGSVGPGAAVGCESNPTFYDKMFSSSLSTTSGKLYAYYKAFSSENWVYADLARSAVHGTELVEGGTLGYAHKTSEIARTTESQPVLNMFFQLGAGAVLESCLRKDHNIDLKVQPTVNRNMARIGSVEQRFGTIDLRSASDSISCSFVDYVMPSRIVDVLREVRSPSVRVDGVYHELKMFSSMGNGFTFPLQTYLFAHLVRAAYVVLGIKPECHGDARNYSVFGDDIVVRSDAYDFVCRLLGKCGFIVNAEKSFNVGPFRESCGRDYFKGHNIRGVYLKEFQNESHGYSLVNRLLRWSTRTECYISAAIAYVEGLVRFRPVPLDEDDAAGIKIPCGRLSSPKRSSLGGIVYHPVVVKIGLKNRPDDGWIPRGMLLTALGGYISSSAGRVVKHDAPFSPFPGVIGWGRARADILTREPVRVHKPAYKIVKRETHSWDFMPYVGLTVQAYDAVCALSLCSLKVTSDL